MDKCRNSLPQTMERVQRKTRLRCISGESSSTECDEEMEEDFIKNIQKEMDARVDSGSRCLDQSAAWVTHLLPNTATLWTWCIPEVPTSYVHHFSSFCSTTPFFRLPSIHVSIIVSMRTPLF